MNKEENLLLKNQLCFPIYAASRRIMSSYTPFLKELGLTYTQYIVMMVLWEKKSLRVKELGDILYLDTGTLTPLLKKLEAAGYITRVRCQDDERSVCISLSAEGEKLRTKALEVPGKMACRLTDGGLNFSTEEVNTLRAELYKIIEALD